MRWTLTLAVVMLILAAGCSDQKTETTKHLTEHQRDSVLAKSSLPGASAVGRAMDAGDREASRAADLGAQLDSLPH